MHKHNDPSGNYVMCACMYPQVFHHHYTREKQFVALIHKESVALLQSLGIGEGAMEKVNKFNAVYEQKKDCA